MRIPHLAEATNTWPENGSETLLRKRGPCNWLKRFHGLGARALIATSVLLPTLHPSVPSRHGQHQHPAQHLQEAFQAVLTAAPCAAAADLRTDAIAVDASAVAPPLCGRLWPHHPEVLSRYDGCAWWAGLLEGCPRCSTRLRQRRDVTCSPVGGMGRRLGGGDSGHDPPAAGVAEGHARISTPSRFGPTPNVSFLEGPGDPGELP